MLQTIKKIAYLPIKLIPEGLPYRDKAGHLIVGGIFYYLIVYALQHYITVEIFIYFFSLVLTALLAIAKEELDKLWNGTPDIKDFIATILIPIIDITIRL